MHDWENWPRITRKTCGLRARAEITSHFAAGRSPQGRGGEGRVSALLPLLDDVRHRLRRGASHLPARRSRQNVKLFLREVNAAPDHSRTSWINDSALQAFIRAPYQRVKPGQWLRNHARDGAWRQ